MIKVIDKQKRSVLGEGRNYQMGFGFLKRTAPNEYETVMPVSACKDYLNDVIWSEHVGKPIGAFGFNYSKQNIFDENQGYMLIGILPYSNGNNYPNQKKDIDNLGNNYLTLQKFINFFEEKIETGIFTSIQKTNIKDKYLVTLPVYWTKGTYLISLYSLLLRVGQFWDGTTDPVNFLTSFDKFNPDIYMARGIVPKILKLMNGMIVEQKMVETENSYTVHEKGIVKFNEL